MSKAALLSHAESKMHQLLVLALMRAQPSIVDFLISSSSAERSAISACSVTSPKLISSFVCVFQHGPNFQFCYFGKGVGRVWPWKTVGNICE